MSIASAPPHARRILYVIGSMGLGGAEQHLRLVSHNLVLLGYQCSVFALDPEGPLRNAFAQSGVPVLGVSLPAWLHRVLPFPRLLARIRLCMAAPVLLWHYWRDRPDVVHFFLPAAYCVGALLSLVAPRMTRVMSRRSLNNYRYKYRLIHSIEKRLHGRMDVICGNSLAVMEQLAGEGVPRNRLRLIYNGVDLQRFTDSGATKEEVRQRLGISPAALVFITVANLIPYKGHRDLIGALSSIKNQLPSDWICLCVGRDDGIGTSLMEQATAEGLEGRVRLLGSRQDVPEVLRAGDIGVLSSHEEGFSNAVLEGMAAGLPMVVTDVGGNAEAVSHGDTGLVVAPRSPLDLGRALLVLSSDPYRASWGQRGRLRVENTFSLAACLQGYVQLYSTENKSS